jgi:nucleoside-diphosphate-sugar epimerase
MTASGRTALVTGTTGNLGALFAMRHMRDGGRVIAPVRTRSGGRDIAARRVIRSMIRLGAPEDELSAFRERGQLLAYEADLASGRVLAECPERASVDCIWHFASSLKYMPRDRDLIHEINVAALQRLLGEVEQQLPRGVRFNYISTAYIAGRSDDILPEAPVALSETRRYTNEYEASKHIAENLVLDHVRDHRLDAVIFRPSIVVGATDTHLLANFNGFYLSLYALRSVKQYVQEAGRGGEPIRVGVDEGAKLNLIPIDLAIDRMRALDATEPVSGSVFNIANSMGFKSRDAVTAVADALALPLVSVAPACFEDVPKTRIEKLLTYGFNYIMPYTNRSLDFAQSRSAERLGGPVCFDFSNGRIRPFIDEYLRRNG